MLRHTLVYVLLVAGILGRVGPSSGEVSPEIQLASRGVMSFNVERMSDETDTEMNDFSDSGLLIGFRQKLYSDYRGGMVIGFQFPDADSDLGQIFFHQMFLKVENRSSIFKMGRSRVQSALIEFPTFRGDDALDVTDVLNPFSSGENSEDSQYGNVIEVAHAFDQRYWVRIHGEHFTETPVPPATSETDFGLNAMGMAFEYHVPEMQRWNRQILNQIGIGMNHFRTGRPGYSSEMDRALTNVLFSTVLNVHPDPVHFWDVRYQTMYNLGFDEVEQVTDYADLTRAKSFSSFISLRYLYRRLEQPTAQGTLAFGYKTFPDLSNSTDQLQFVANGFYRLGEEFDVGVQYQYGKISGDLKSLYEENEHRIQLTLIYSVDQLWNNQFDDRHSLLNLEHGYIP